MSRVVTSSGTIDYGLVWGGFGAKVKFRTYPIKEGRGTLPRRLYNIDFLLQGDRSEDRPPDFCSQKLKKLL